MYKKLGSVLLGAFLLIPFAANAATVEELRAQAQALLAQVAALQAQYGGNTGGTVTYGAANASLCPQLGRSVYRGISGSDVLRLQKFLAGDPGIYPEAILSGYFGVYTERAVQRWQAKYHVIAAGPGYGVAGPRTAAAMAILCSTGSYNGVPGPTTQKPVSGFISVSPISGEAPLTVNVTATVNTANSCTGAIYTLDYGDGSAPQQIPVSAGNCEQLNQTYPHVYQYGGTYLVKLSAGAHSTSATVTVSGAPKPPPPVFTPGLPNETFSASPNTGPAPLTVTFKGTVNSNDAGFCLGGCASALDFGDGTMASIDLPATVGGWLNYTATHIYKQSGGYRATLYQGGAGSAQPKVGTATIIVDAAVQPSTQTYYPPIISTSTSNSLIVNVAFGLPTSCTGYVLSWGDGSTDVIQNDGGVTGCAQTSVDKTLSHQYAAAGNYTVILKRGPTFARVDAVPIVAGGLAGGAYTYSPPTPSASGAAPLTLNLAFDLPSSCTGYRLSWGDGSADSIQNDGGTGCAQTPVVKILPHTYAATGTYTIVLKRGPTLIRIDDVSLTIYQ